MMKEMCRVRSCFAQHSFARSIPAKLSILLKCGTAQCPAKADLFDLVIFYSKERLRLVIENYTKFK